MAKGGNGTLAVTRNGTTYYEQEDDDEEEQWSPAVFIVQNKIWFFLVFTAIAVPSGYIAPNLFQAVSEEVSWDVLEGTPTERAQYHFLVHFPHLVGATTESILINCQYCDSLVEGSVRPIVHDVVDKLNVTLFNLNISHTGIIQNTQSYYDFEGVLHPNPMLSIDHKWMLWQWRWKIAPDRVEEATLMSDTVFDVVKKMNKNATISNRNLEVIATGPHAFHKAITAETKTDVGVHAVAFLPIALAILGAAVGSCTLLILPLLSAAGGLCTSFATMSIIAKFMPVNAMAPAMMAFFNIALAVDYSLFLLTRYVDERRAGQPYEMALRITLEQSGMVVLLSGNVLMVASLSGLFLPGGFAGMAVASAVTILSCMLWNLCFVPSIVGLCPWCFDDCCTRMPERTSFQKRKGPISDNERALQPCRSSFKEMEHRLVRSPWYKWACVITRWPCNLLLALSILLIFLPLTMVFMNYQPSIDYTLSYPSGDPATEGAKKLRELFSAGVGCPSPLYILVAPRITGLCPPTVKSNAYFYASCEFAQHLIQETQGTPYALSAQNLLGVTFHPKFQTTVSNNVTCIAWNNGLFEFSFDANSLLTKNGMVKEYDKLRQIYRAMWSRLVSEDEQTSVIAINPPIDALSKEGFKLVQQIRDTIDNWNPQQMYDDQPVCQLKMWLLSEPSIIYDFVSITMKKLPKALLATVALSFLLIGMTYCSAFIPIKLLFTVALPLSWAYGLAVLVFQYGVLDWINIRAISDTGGLLWMMPVMTCTLLLGLALDYDLFLYSRVWEIRKDGYGNRDAIRMAMASTGGVITSAGCIFVCEWSGLLLSTIRCNNQLGSTVIMAVLIDTFVVENVLVPAALSLGADLNWWPVKMPAVTKEIGKFTPQNLEDGKEMGDVVDSSSMYGNGHENGHTNSYRGMDPANYEPLEEDGSRATSPRGSALGSGRDGEASGEGESDEDALTESSDENENRTCKFP